MKRNVRIPITLVSLAEKERKPIDERLVLAERLTPQEIISQQGRFHSDTEIAIVGIENADRRDIIIAALFLRNRGRTVIVCDLQNIPIELVQDTFNFTVRSKSEGKAVRTEVLLTPEAMDQLGDISDVVAYFEKEFVAN